MYGNCLSRVATCVGGLQTRVSGVRPRCVGSKAGAPAWLDSSHLACIASLLAATTIFLNNCRANKDRAYCHRWSCILSFKHGNVAGTTQTSDELASRHEPRSAFLCVAGTQALSVLPAGAAIKWNHRRGQVVWHDAHGRPIRLFCLSSHVCRPVGRLADRLGRATAWRARGRGSGVERLARRSTQAGLLRQSDQTPSTYRLRRQSARA